ncbi:MAG: hypothetical protein S4CHLAM102_04190 [Chlamydiia bacterium]|nr:hypothetical protein [Chlamydiia bacterium]
MATKKKQSAFMKPCKLSSELEAVCGKGPMPRTEVTKKLWDYIKKKKLQNPENKREILCDDRLKALFSNKKKINMFEMTKHVSNHLS